MVEIICKQCKKTFEVYPSRIKKGGGIFCSISCGITYRNITNNPTNDPEVRQKISKNHADVSGKNNPMYGRRGKLCPSYIDGRNSMVGEVYRKIALINLEKTCKICDENNIKKLHVHHRDGNRKNNDINNLVFICCKCHLTIAHKTVRDSKGRFIKNNLNVGVVL